MSSALLSVTPERNLTGARPRAFPNVFVKREDFLPTAVIEPPHPSRTPSPPASGFSDLLEDVDVMFSRVSPSSARKRPGDLEEVTLMDLGRYFPSRRQSPEISESDFEPEEDDDDDDEDYEETVQARSSRSDVKPPARSFTRLDTVPTSTCYNPRSAPGSPRICSEQQATPVKTRSSPSTALGSFTSQSSRKRMATTPEPSPSRQDTTTDDDLDDKNNVEDDEAPGASERYLRKRTLQQTNPYKFDKHRHQLSWKAGHEASSKKVEIAVKEEIGVTDKQLTAKRRRGSSGNSAKGSSPKRQTRNKRNGSNSVGSEEIYGANTFDPARTMFRVRLDGFAGGAATLITLSECEHNDKLIDFILKSWEWKFKGAGFSHAVASFPWLTTPSDVLLRPGLNESFQGVVAEIANAPIWAEGGQARCEVEVAVYLQ